MADWHIVISFLTIVSVIAENYVVAVFPETGSQAQEDTDKFLLSILFAMHLVFNLVFAIVVLRHLSRRGSTETANETPGTCVHIGEIRKDTVEYKKWACDLLQLIVYMQLFGHGRAMSYEFKM